MDASPDLEAIGALRALALALDDAPGLAAGLGAAVGALVPGIADACALHRDGAPPIVAGAPPAGEPRAHVLEVPLRAGGRALGALRLERSAARPPWGERDRLVADTFAAHLARAIEQDALAAAVAAARHYDTFLATLSHELRSPLGVISGWIELLQGDRLSADRRAQALEVVARNARVQRRLIEDILEASRIVAGTLRLELGEVALDQVVADAVEAVRPQAEAARLELAAGALAPARVLGDPVRLGQVVHNLLGNALRYTDAGGRIDVALATAGGAAVLTVADTGAGIAPELLPHVFERFRQGERRRAGGTRGLGLGLFIVRHLVLGHGGAITAASDGPGRGATFTVTLPRLPAPAP